MTTRERNYKIIEKAEDGDTPNVDYILSLWYSTDENRNEYTEE
jgi:hypothetical protein